MKHDLQMDFSVDKDNRAITVKREFAASLATVWAAFTTSELLDQWWAPRPWKARTKEMNFAEGGHWLYAMVGPAGEEHWALANYTAIEPQRSFTGLDAFADADGKVNEEMPKSKWNVSFSEANGVTLVTFQITYDDLAQLEATLQMGFKEGLTMAMEGLDEVLAK